MKILPLLIGSLIVAAPVAAQSVASLKRELREKESAARGDADALVEVALWAEEKGLVSDRRRILNNVLKLAPDHEKAHDLLGFVKFDGEWMTKSKAEALAKKAREAEMKEKGFVEVDGVWVAKDEVDDAKRGIYHHDGTRVSKAEKIALLDGKVRHPVTGEFIDASDLPKANADQFPLGSSGRWGDEAVADAYHKTVGTPWVFRTHYATVISNKPLADLKDISRTLDAGFESAQRILGEVEPSPTNRPVILIAQTTEQFISLGEQIGDEGSAYAVFRATGMLEAQGVSPVRPIVMNWDKDWGQYWLRHAAGLGLISAILEDTDATAPLWFERGVAGYAERLFNPGVASHFGKAHLQKGGVSDLAGWFANFEISGDLGQSELDFNMYQAGLVLEYAMQGGDAAAKSALDAVRKAVADGDGRALTKAITALQEALAKAEDGVRERLRTITSQ